MLRIITWFYRLLAILSFLGFLVLTSNSSTPLPYFLSGVLSLLIWLSFSEIVEAKDKHIKLAEKHITFQRKALTQLVKRSNGRE